ncbi:MAG: 4Fe-4S dicluster domain-containing protein [Chloroflexi bacterium]|nr:MAG: 4Fe-4S dicluster domain-containing protein [Chloroflexota bacterium]
MSSENLDKATKPPPVENVARRRFLQALAGAAGAGLALTNLSRIAAEGNGELQAVSDSAADPASLAPPITSGDGVSALERMRGDIQRALAKAPEDRRWVMVIDLRKCVGCHACTVSCVAENHLPPGVVYRPVLEEETGTFPNVAKRFIPRPCMQCDQPPCVPVCPVNATFKNEEGVVEIDYDQCIGCRYCITACPYGARTFDFGGEYADDTPVAEGIVVGREVAASYERATNFEYAEARTREGDRDESPVGNVRKCHFCLHRVREGMLPACVTTCIGTATYFGDANDPESLVSELIASPNVMRLKEELGTEPRVYYLT